MVKTNESRIEFIDSNGNIKYPLSLLYVLLKSGIAYIDGRHIVIKSDLSNIDSIWLRYKGIVPEVNFCPSGSPEVLDVNDILKDICIEVYKYFEDRCAACAIKVYSILGETWFIGEEKLLKILDIAIEYQFPIEWSKGNIVLTTCPEDYETAKNMLRPGDYIKGLERLRKALQKLLQVSIL